MHGWDITRLRSKSGAKAFLLLLTFLLWAGAQAEILAQTQPAPPASDSKPSETPAQAPATAPPAQENQQKPSGDNGVFVFRKRSEEHTSELQSPDHLVC